MVLLALVKLIHQLSLVLDFTFYWSAEYCWHDEAHPHSSILLCLVHTQNKR